MLRRLLLAGQLPARRPEQALTDLVELPVRRALHRPLLRRCRELRASVSIYDAAYVALAEALGVLLLTGDRRLARAAGLDCQVEVLAAG